MDIKAVILNCTLKKSPEVSNTEALITKVVDLMSPLGVESEIVRVVDYTVPFGVESDLGPGDDWPYIYAKLKAADIVIIGTPILVRRARLGGAADRAPGRQLQRRRPGDRAVPVVRQGCRLHRHRQRGRRPRLP